MIGIKKEMELICKMKVKVKKEVWNKLLNYVKAAEGEVGGLLRVKVKGENIFIDKCELLAQTAGMAHFELDEEALADFMIKNKKQMKHYKGWWHSHVNMGTFFSGTDDETFNLMANMGGLCVGVVMNKKGSDKWQIQINVNEMKIFDTPQVEKDVNLMDYFNRYKTLDKDKLEVDTKVKKYVYPVFNNDIVFVGDAKDNKRLQKQLNELEKIEEMW